MAMVVIFLLYPPVITAAKRRVDVRCFVADKLGQKASLP